MSIPQAASSSHGGPLQRRQQSPVTVFLVGFPLAGLVLGLIHLGPLKDSPYRRYFIHPVECVEVVLFCCALTALGGKLWRYGREQRACQTKFLPAWDGQSVPVSEAVHRRRHPIYIALIRPVPASDHCPPGGADDQRHRTRRQHRLAGPAPR